MANNENDLKCAMPIVSNYTVNPQLMVDNFIQLLHLLTDAMYVYLRKRKFVA